jgi:hypothetical protein
VADSYEACDKKRPPKTTGPRLGRKGSSRAKPLTKAPAQIDPEQHYSIRPGPILHGEVSQRAELASRGPDKLNQHRVGKRDLLRYYALLECSRNKLDFTEAEARALVEAIHKVRTIDVSPKDAWITFLHGVGPKLTPEQMKLSDKLRELSAAEATAMVDAVERYWVHHEGDMNDLDAVRYELASVGLIGPTRAVAAGD